LKNNDKLFGATLPNFLLQRITFSLT